MGCKKGIEITSPGSSIDPADGVARILGCMCP